MEAETESPHVRAVTNEEMQIAFSGPAVLANRFFVTLGSGGARIAFGEQGQPEGPTFFRGAFVLPFQDAVELAKVLRAMLSPIEQQIAAAKAAEDAKS